MALKAGRVGVRPDQVDRYGRITVVDKIVAKALNKLYGDVPFLNGKWTKVTISSDGTYYSIVSDISGFTAASGALSLPEGYYAECVMYGAKSIQAHGTEQPTSYQYGSNPITISGKTVIKVPLSNNRFEINVWLLMREITTSLSDSRSTKIDIIDEEVKSESTKKSTKKTTEK